MANRRMINKDDMDSPNFGELTIQQRYLFWAIMLNADDDGIMPTELVKAKCFPYDEISRQEVKDNLIALKVWSFITIYDEDKYLGVLNWWNRQFIDLKIYKPSAYPKYIGYEPRPTNLTKDRGSRRTLEQNRKGKRSEEEFNLEKNSSAQVSEDANTRMLNEASDVFYPKN